MAIARILQRTLVSSLFPRNNPILTSIETFCTMTKLKKKSLARFDFFQKFFFFELRPLCSVFSLCIFRTDRSRVFEKKIFRYRKLMFG